MTGNTLKIIIFYGSLALGVLAVEAGISFGQQLWAFPLAVLFVAITWLWLFRK